MTAIAADIDDQTLQSLGWKEMSGGFGFTELAGPWWVRHTDSGRVMGLRLGEQHGNQHIGTVHGGVLMTLADNGLGAAVSHAIDGLHCVTISLQTQFVSAAKVGEFIYCEGEVVRRTKSLVFVRGFILAGDRTVASADGIWKVLEAR
ncbi:MAG: PaaI family thioesterase [Halioglobus sp.]|nr:PaaI family thioesterase [Halioglobus sp.]